MRAHRGSGGITTLILNIRTRWSRMVSLKPRPHCPRGKSSQYH